MGKPLSCKAAVSVSSAGIASPQVGSGCCETYPSPARSDLQQLKSCGCAFCLARRSNCSFGLRVFSLFASYAVTPCRVGLTKSVDTNKMSQDNNPAPILCKRSPETTTGKRWTPLKRFSSSLRLPQTCTCKIPPGVNSLQWWYRRASEPQSLVKHAASKDGQKNEGSAA